MARRFVPSGDYPYLRGDVGYGKTISASEIQSQFSDTGSVSWSELYKGGDIVSNTDGAYLLGSNAQEVPSSGKISVSDFLIRPFWDQHYYCSSTGTTSTHTFTVPSNRGYKNMRIYIQGAGGSGTYGYPSGNFSWGTSVSYQLMSGAGGGNGGGYAVKNSVSITDGDTIFIHVGAGGQPPSGVFQSNAASGSLGANGTANGNAGASTYVQVNGTTVLRVDGGRIAATNRNMQIFQHDVNAAFDNTNTYTVYAEPTEDPGTTSSSGGDVYLKGGQGGMGYTPNATWQYGGSTRNYGANNYVTSGIGFGGAAAGYITSDQGHDIRGEGYWHTGSWPRTMRSDWGSAHGVPVHSSKGVSARMQRSGLRSGYGYGGTGNWANGSDLGINAQQWMAGGDGFARIMFYDKDWTGHTSYGPGFGPTATPFT